MNVHQVVRAAIPQASEELSELILWDRTPFPCGRITARSLYRAADRFRRANDNGISLCDCCDRPAQEGRYLCEHCKSALEAA